MLASKLLVEGECVKQLFKRNKTAVLVAFIIILLIAGWLDIRYKGLFFQLLPESVQSYVTDNT